MSLLMYFDGVEGVEGVENDEKQTFGPFFPVETGVEMASLPWKPFF